MREKVVFDTNQVNNSAGNNLLGNREELNKFAKVVEIIIPEIVLEEIKNSKKRNLKRKQSSFLSNPFHSLRGLVTQETKDFDIEKHIQNLIDNEEFKFSIISLKNNDALNEIKDLALKKEPPFENKDNTDKGFKDALIYFSILEFLDEIPDKYIFVCVEDGRFKEALEKHDNIIVIKDFDEYTKHRIAQFQDDYFLGKVDEELGLEFKKNEVLDYWININKNQVVLFEKEGIAYVIEVDTGELITVTNREEYLDTIEMLINASNFGTTHEAIERLENYIQFLSEEEIARILIASFQNDQVRWIINDEDVKQFIGKLFKSHDELEDLVVQGFLEEIFD